MLNPRFALGVALLLTLVPAATLGAQTATDESDISSLLRPRPLDSRLTLPEAGLYVGELIVSEPIGQQESRGWTKLANIGPGRDAIVTLIDGTLRGGQIVEIQSQALRLLVGGNVMTIARSDIASVRVKRKRGTLIGGLAGYLISAVALTAIICAEAGDCNSTAIIVGGAFLGLPGGLLGALIGSQVGGDVEIVP